MLVTLQKCAVEVSVHINVDMHRVYDVTHMHWVCSFVCNITFYSFIFMIHTYFLRSTTTTIELVVGLC